MNYILLLYLRHILECNSDIEKSPFSSRVHVTFLGNRFQAGNKRSLVGCEVPIRPHPHPSTRYIDHVPFHGFAELQPSAFRSLHLTLISKILSRVYFVSCSMIQPCRSSGLVPSEITILSVCFMATPRHSTRQDMKRVMPEVLAMYSLLRRTPCCEGVGIFLRLRGGLKSHF
jgi:hypothetical protein